MKQLVVLLSIVILITMFSCEQSVTFTSSQPSDTTNLLKFPKQVQGRYLSLSDSTILEINNSVITRTYNYVIKTHPNNLLHHLLFDGFVVVGDSIIDKETNDKYYVEYKKGNGLIYQGDRLIYQGDSLIVHGQWIDTLFQIGNKNVLRKYKENYLLGIFCDNKAWDLWKLKLSGKQLKITNIVTNPKIKNDTSAISNFLKQASVVPWYNDFKVRNGELFIKQ